MSDLKLEDDDMEIYDILDPSIRAKWVMDGASTLDECAGLLEGFAVFLRLRAREGWKLREPVEDDYGFVYHDELSGDKF